MQLLREATPGGGAYVNEADYFEPDWRRSFWGEQYPRLLAIKRKYDPTGLFTCHHCVGSDEP
jgi:FAD/FMN-containing dehydrogenase